jgi:hypothetical protein
MIDGIVVELASLAGLSHRCRPRLCRRSRFCCAAYEVEVDEGELATIVGLLPEAGRYAPALWSGNGWANVFEEGEGGLYTLDSDEEGLCVFAYRRSSGGRRCALHTAAQDLGLSPYRAKPRCCALWPLALWETSTPVLGLHEDIFSFPCNAPRPHDSRDLDPGVAALIRENFSQGFLAELNNYLKTI